MRRHDQDPWHSSIHTNCPPAGTLFAAKQWLWSQHLDKKSHEVSPLSHEQYFKPAPGSAARAPDSSGGDRVVSVASSGCSPPASVPPRPPIVATGWRGWFIWLKLAKLSLRSCPLGTSYAGSTWGWDCLSRSCQGFQTKQAAESGSDSSATELGLFAC